LRDARSDGGAARYHSRGCVARAAIARLLSLVRMVVFPSFLARDTTGLPREGVIAGYDVQQGKNDRGVISRRCRLPGKAEIGEWGHRRRTNCPKGKGAA
jgi:hypothetical protein